jgi:hypothetical protein
MADRQPFDPKTTAFTNLALDEIMPRVSPNAWKIICVAIRKTQGWADPDSPTGRKQSDVIAQSQFMTLTGIASENTVKAAIAECVAAGYLLKVPKGQSFRYSLNLTYALSDTAKNDTVNAPTVSEVDTNGINNRYPTVSIIADTNSNSNNKEAAAPFSAADLKRSYLDQSTPKRVIDHETVPVKENLYALSQAFQRGTGQKETQTLPIGTSLLALRQMNDEAYTALDVEAYARMLKAGWWSDKMLPLAKVAEGIGQWVSSGRPGDLGPPSPTGKRVVTVVDAEGNKRQVEVT